MPTQPRWSCLTAETERRDRPLRQALDELMAGDLRGVQGEYRASMGELHVVSAGSNPGTIGTAFDLALRFLIDPEPDMRLAGRGAARFPGNSEALMELAEQLGAVVSGPETRQAAGSRVLRTPLRVPERDLELVTRACWAFALFVEVYRTGPMPGTPLVDHLLGTATPTATDLLNLAPVAATQEIVALLQIARVQLLQPLARRPAPWFVGPEFTGSTVMPADTDLIAGGMLVEVKTSAGAKRQDGTRRPELPGQTVRQILGYVLHDTDDTYQLDALAIYDARRGTLIQWPLQALLDRLAGRHVDLADERFRHARLLETGKLPKHGSDGKEHRTGHRGRRPASH